MLQTIGWYISIGFGFLALVCWFGAFFFGIRAHILRKPGVSWVSPRLNVGSGYTEAGVQAFKRGWVCVLGFLLCRLLGVAIGIMTGAFGRTLR
jgi:hypothetical protein